MVFDDVFDGNAAARSQRLVSRGYGRMQFDPIENTLSTDPRYALDFIQSCLEPYGLGDRWCYVNYLGTEYFGHTRERWRQVSPTATFSSIFPAAVGPGATSTKRSRTRPLSTAIPHSPSWALFMAVRSA